MESKNALPPVSELSVAITSCDAKLEFMLFSKRAAVVRARSAQAPRRSIAQRRNRLQPTRVHAVDRKIRAHRRIDRRPQRRLVLNPIARNAARKIQQRLLLRDLLERLRDRPQRKQLAIGIQIVVFALIRRIARRIFRLVRVRGRSLRKPLALGPVVDTNFVAPAPSLSAVKSWSTFSVSPSETSATRSAGCILLFRKSRAASTQRSRSSGCIDVRSKNITISR